MKYFGVIAAIALLLGIVNASQIGFQCPRTTGVSCLQDPCRTTANKCVKGQICCANYKTGCNVDCYQCPTTTGVSCLQDPCEAQPDACPGQSCCADYTNDCDVKCY